MKTLVTGACGFVGSAVTIQLLKAGHEVRVLLRPESDRCNLAQLMVEVAVGDLRDVSSLTKALVGCGTLFHVAADYRLWVPSPREMYESNVNGTKNLMLAAAAAGVERIVYTSSVATLGLHSDGSPADEETPATLSDMVGHYKRSKFLAEAEVRRFVKEEGLPAIIVNPSTPVGPRDIKPTPTGQMIQEAASGRMPAFVDTGLNIVHVDDVAKGHVQAYEKGRPGQRYILGAKNMTLKEILYEIAKITGQPAPKFKLPHNLVYPVAYAMEAWSRLRKGQPPLVTVDGIRLAKKKMFFSNAKARRELGFEPRPIDTALTDAVAWFKKNGYLDN